MKVKYFLNKRGNVGGRVGVMATGVVGGYGDGETGRGMCGQVRTINENERGGPAELLGIPPWTLSSKLKRLGIRKEHLA